MKSRRSASSSAVPNDDSGMRLSDLKATATKAQHAQRSSLRLPYPSKYNAKSGNLDQPKACRFAVPFRPFCAARNARLDQQIREGWKQGASGSTSHHERFPDKHLPVQHTFRQSAPVNLGSQVDQVNPHSLYFHPCGFQVLGLLWVSLEEPGGGATTERKCGPP